MIQQFVGEPEVWGAFVGVGAAGTGWIAIQVIKGVAAMIDLKILKNGKAVPTDRCSATHCKEHAALVGDVREIKTDVKWLKKHRQDDRTHLLLDGILKNLVQEKQKKRQT